MGASKTTPRTLAEIKAAILAGDQSVTAEELARAHADAELAELQAEAERQAAARRAEAERLDAIRAVRADVLDAEAQLDDAADLAAITEAAARIIARHKRLAEVVRDARIRLARLKMPAGVQVEGIRWLEAAMGRADSVEVDGRHHTITPHPGRVVGQALLAACEQAGTNQHVLSPSVQLQVHRQRTPEQMAAAEQRNQAARQAALKRIAERQAQHV